MSNFNVDYAIFSAESYEQSGNTLEQGLKAAGYELVGEEGTAGSGGFHARAWKKGNEIVIAYEGSADRRDFVLTDGSIYFDKEIPFEASEAVNFYDKIASENPECSITATGHSLGGALAYVVADDGAFSDFGDLLIGIKDGISNFTNLFEVVEKSTENIYNGYDDEMKVTTYEIKLSESGAELWRNIMNKRLSVNKCAA